MSNKDPQNPLTATTANDLAAELVQKVVEWYRDHRNALSAAQQTAAITAITNVLSGTNKV